MLHLADDDLHLILRAPLFAGIPRDQLLGLIDGAGVSTYGETNLLFSQGDVADRFFVVLDGRVNLFALTDKGDQTIIEVFDKGWTFAEAAMFSSGRYPLNAEVGAGTRLLSIPVAPFLRRLSEHRELAFQMLSALSGWQRHLLTELAELKSKSPVQRLGAFLLHLARVDDVAAGAAASSAASSAVEVRLPVTKTVLASRIGIAPESLSRAIARLRSVGVESRGRDLVITDIAALRRFCHSAGEE
jgi:CRP-like cAMP-binding protein